MPLVDRFNLLRQLVPPARTRTTLARGVIVFVPPPAENKAHLANPLSQAQLAWDGRSPGLILQLRRPVGIRLAEVSAAFFDAQVLPPALLLRLVFCVNLYTKLRPVERGNGGDDDDGDAAHDNDARGAHAIALWFAYAALAVCAPAVVHFLVREWRAEFGCAAPRVPPSATATADEKRGLLSGLQRVLPSDAPQPAVAPVAAAGRRRRSAAAGGDKEDAYYRTHGGALGKTGATTYMPPHKRVLLSRVRDSLL